MKKLLTICTVIGSILLLVTVTKAAEFNGAADNERDDLGYYYVITGGKFPTGNIPNGDNASGGTFRWLSDDPSWGAWSLPIDVWHKDGWFPQNASLALTFKNGGSIVYDNNGLEDGTHDGFYDYSDHLPEKNWATPGLYRGYAMSNNWDWIYTGYFKLDSPTTIDTIIGYFDNGVYGFDPDNPNIAYRMNIWSSFQDNPGGNPNSYMPAVASFTGDVFSSSTTSGNFIWSDTGVDRIFPDWSGYAPDDIFRMTFTLDTPVVLPSGVYFFSHDAIIRELVDIDIKPQSCPNPLNIKSKGVLPVAILGTVDFNVSSIDITTLKLNGETPVKNSIEDVTAPSELEPCGCEELDPDSFEDLVLKFDKQAIIETLGEGVQNGDEIELTLTGDLLDGTAIVGIDCVVIKGVK